MRERKGRALPFVVDHKGEATDMIHDIVERGTTVYADEAPSWDILHAHYETKRINHNFAFSDDDACTNQAESYFSRLRRAGTGQHHRVGVHLAAYAGEMAWRENNRRQAERDVVSVGGGVGSGQQAVEAVGGVLAGDPENTTSACLQAQSVPDVERLITVWN